MPEYSCHRRLTNSVDPSGRMANTIAGMVSITSRSCRALRSAASSACLRAVTSRRMTVNSHSPPSASFEMDASAGNSLPSLRRPVTSRLSAIARAVSGARANRSMCRRWIFATLGGRSRSTGRPTISDWR
jgi:hypothetical protein